MSKRHLSYAVGSVAIGACAWAILARAAEPASVAQPNGSRLAVVWSSGDPDVAHRVCLMYTHAAVKNRWFNEVRLIVWGPSARLLAGDKDLQAKIKEMMKDGVNVQACIVCADSYGVTEALRSLGIEVNAMGRPLTDFLKSDYKVLTF
ncbi:MAG: DsrE family protein [Phycisphaerae bacterium]|nr:DsrE family protein [Phycisphaerae bacterium]